MQVWYDFKYFSWCWRDKVWLGFHCRGINSSEWKTWRQFGKTWACMGFYLLVKWSYLLYTVKGILLWIGFVSCYYQDQRWWYNHYVVLNYLLSWEYGFIGQTCNHVDNICRNYHTLNRKEEARMIIIYTWFIEQLKIKKTYWEPYAWWID